MVLTIGVLFSFIKAAITCTVASHVLAGPVLLYKKREFENLQQADNPGDQYNNVSSNVNLANWVFNVAIVACFIVVGSTGLLVDWKDNAFIPALFSFMLTSFIINVIIPFELLMKVEIRRHAKANIFDQICRNNLVYQIKDLGNVEQ